MKTVLKILEWVFFIVIICIIAIIASPFLLSKQAVSSYTVVSGSMVPTIQIGTLTFVQQTPFSSLQKGDVIAFTDPTNNNRVILHRVYNVKEYKGNRVLQTKGDHNPYPDGWQVTSPMVKGRLFYSIPYIGNLSEWLKNPLGFGIMIGIPALLLIILSILKIREGIKDEIAKGVAKRENANPPSTHTASIFIVPLLVAAFILAYVPSVYAVQFGHVNVDFSVSTAIALTPTPTPTIRPTATPTMTPHPTATPTPTKIPTPTPTKSCGGNTNINVSGNGAGSNNNVTVNNNCNTKIIQTNNTNINTTVNTTVSTGNNTSSFNTFSQTTSTSTNSTGLTLISGDASAIVTLTTQGSSNSASVSH